ALGGALDDLGLSADGRVASFAWNSDNHLELYFGVPCTGRVLHTVNVRLFTDQLEYIIDHAGDEAIFCDRSVAPVLAQILPRLDAVRHVVLMDDGADDALDDPRVIDYEELLSAATPVEFPDLDEERAAYLCYTSGTTGRPRGVVYSHRSTFVHTLGVTAPDAFNVSERDAVLPVVPMFHALTWGLAHAAVAAGAQLLMPGRDLSPTALVDLIEGERATLTAGVPTVWISVLEALEGRDVSSLEQIICGGSAVPKALSEAYRERTGSAIIQAWGMTELHPVGTVNRVKSELSDRDEEELAELRTSQGLPVTGVELRIADLETGDALPWDGQARGELQCRGPWVARQYYGEPDGSSAFSEDGWLRSGDIATIDPHGYVRIVDRTKDLIKSGGEWISSVDLENELMAHPDVAEAAVVGVPDPRWQERPVACVVLRPQATLDSEALLAFLSTRVPKWWLPDEILAMDQLPRTATGKFSKVSLREQLSDRFGSPT
ncbi:MAG: long-chain fatty acid--CoA ligase, partial [Gaiellales bacterium]